MKKRNTWAVNYLALLALLFIFIIGSLVLMNVGVRVYKNIVVNNGENYRLRTSLSYLATKIRQSDEVGAVSVTEEDGVPVLLLKEKLDSGDYRTMLYCYDGHLRELFQEEGMEYKLEDGMEIVDLNRMEIEQQENRIVLTAVDGEEQERLVIYLRSEGE